MPSLPNNRNQNCSLLHRVAFSLHRQNTDFMFGLQWDLPNALRAMYKNIRSGMMRSYAGLILNGFLLPQILFSIFRGQQGKLCLVHSTWEQVPDAYNQYRAHNYLKFDLNATDYYANPAADFHSTAWNIIIHCGVVALAVIVFLQQRHGGFCILPQRFRGLEMYEEVPTVDIE